MTAPDAGSAPGGPELRALGERAKARLVEVRAALADRAAAGAPGRELCEALTAAADAVLRELFEAARAATRGLPPDLCVVATGGYGRAELLPYSDLDLVFLVPRRATPEVTKLAEAVLYPLWDARLDVGHAVRTPAEMVALAREDLTSATELLDTRVVCGPEALHEDLAALARREFERDVNGFIRRLAEERKGRHSRFGDTLYLLEPNLKNGEGGHRDLMIGLWAARARYAPPRTGETPPGFHALALAGALGERQAGTLEDAREYLLRVRFHCHTLSRRRQDQLTFQLQEAIAPVLYPDVKLGPGESRPALAPAVEELMRACQLHAKTVKRETDRLLERSVIPPRKAPVIRRVDSSFSTFNGRLTTHGLDVLEERPAEAVRIFRVALDLGAEIHGHTADLLAEFARRAGPRLQTREAAEHFLALLVDPRDAGNPSLLEQLHDLGILNALIPEFAPCTGRVQHDLYHVFTVDQHSLYAVQYLKRLQRGELGGQHAVPSQVIKDVARPRALYLGMLLHDIGKPLGKGHSEKGARLALEIAPRLGLDEQDTARVELLVRRHLVMSHLSQRRDMHDNAMIAHFAADVGDEETLRELYLLTFSDMTMTNPGAMSHWREMLLAELYERTLAFLRRGPDLAGRDSSAAAKNRRKKVLEACADLGDAERRAVEALPDRYFSLNPAAEARKHASLIARRVGGEPFVGAVEHRPKKGYSELILCTDDHPGLLSQVAGVLVASRIDVLGAQIHTFSATLPGGRSVELALDVFYVRDRYGKAIQDDARWRTVMDLLARVTKGGDDVDEVVRRSRSSGALPPRHEPEVLTEIEIDNQVSSDFTVIDVYTQDRPGVLYAVTRTLAELGLDIHLSKIATEANRVADVFYVRDRDGSKVWNEERQAEIRSALEAGLTRTEPVTKA